MIIILIVIVIVIVAIGIMQIMREKTEQPSEQTDKQPSQPRSRAKKSVIKQEEANYLTPTIFAVDLMPASCRAANVCNPDVMYPPKELQVEYGLEPIPKDCPCLQFVAPP